MKEKIQTIAIFLVLALMINFLIPTLSNLSLALDNGYVITFQAEEGHGFSMLNGDLRIDDIFVLLKDGENKLGTVDVNGNIATITVDSNTPGKLEYNTNKFTLFNTSGHVEYDKNTSINSDVVFLVENYAGVNVDFATEAIANNVATYNVDNVEVTLTVTGGNIAGGTLPISRNNLGSVTFTLGNTYNSETMQVVVRGAEQYSQVLNVNNNTFTLNGLNFPGNNINISVESQNQGGDPYIVEDGIEITTMEFTINGQACTITADNSVVNVPADTNFESLEEFYITRIVSKDRATDEVKDITFAPGKYGLNIKDNQNRPVLETNLTKQTTSLAFVRVEAHVDAITDEHLAILEKTSDDIVGFYLPQIVLVKPNPQGLVGIETPNKPDVYDFTAFNGVELGDTSIDNFSEVSVYYGDDTIDLSGIGCNITNIELVEGKGVLSSAVEIDVTNRKVKIKSNFYNEIPLKITVQMGDQSTIVGYVKIVRVGIYINDLNKGANVFYHGAFNGSVNENGGNLNVDTDKSRLVAVFYHDNTKTVNDFDLVVNIVKKDGTTETKLAKPVGDVNDEGSPLVGSDYIVYEGDSYEDFPTKVYVTAVKKGATSGAATTFGGATFGAGAGVTWVNGR